ncbi:MAG: MarR family winged helix-turn-helix transcriptional regulator [Vicinamibacterales bacterium]
MLPSVARSRPAGVRQEIRQTRPFASSAQEATVALLRTADVVRRHLTRVVQAEDITLQQYNVLRILRGAQGQPLSALDIQDRLIEEAPGVSRLIDRLVAKGLVARTRAVEDRRLLECTITASGLALLARLDAAVDRADTDLVEPLGDRRIATLIGLLAAIRRARP